MTIKETNNPLSITNRVRDRIEKQASGVQPSSHASYASHTPHNNAYPHPTDGHSEDLSDQFLGLLMNATSSETKTRSFPSLHSNRNFADGGGTKSFFSPLNKQEESVNGTEETKAPFSLVIENSSLGPLHLQGKWLNGVLHVGLKLPKRPSHAEQKVLCAMLSKGLSSQLGVPLEISID